MEAKNTIGNCEKIVQIKLMNLSYIHRLTDEPTDEYITDERKVIYDTFVGEVAPTNISNYVHRFHITDEHTKG
jgi:hypothetical protein